MGTKILRLSDVFGPGKPLPVRHTKFYKDYVLQAGGDEFIPGTNIPRLRLVPLGGRAVGVFQDELDALLEALRDLRDASPLRSRALRHTMVNRVKRARTAKSRRCGSTPARKAGADDAVARCKEA
jgi:hypothetical protein